MDGYLRTLANRVLGATSDLRSVRSIRTAAPSAAWAHDTNEYVVPDADAEPSNHPALPRVDEVESSRKLPPAAEPAKSATTSRTPVTFDRPIRQPEEFRQPEHTPAGNAGSVAMPRRAPARPIDRTTVQLHQEPDAVPRAPVHIRDAPADPALADFEAQRPVAGLVPVQKPSSGAAGRRGPPAAAMPGNNGDPAAIEVHIHIGRVELTAAPAAVTRTPAAGAEKTKPMSLDTYLRQRRGRTE